MTSGKLEICKECGKLGISTTMSKKHCRHCGYEEKAECDSKGKDVAYDFRVDKMHKPLNASGRVK
jgi:ribosomal protein L37E